MLKQVTINTVQTLPMQCPKHQTFRYTDPLMTSIALSRLGIPEPYKSRAISKMSRGNAGSFCIDLPEGVHVEVTVKDIAP